MLQTGHGSQHCLKRYICIGSIILTVLCHFSLQVSDLVTFTITYTRRYRTYDAVVLKPVKRPREKRRISCIATRHSPKGTRMREIPSTYRPTSDPRVSFCPRARDRLKTMITSPESCVSLVRRILERHKPQSERTLTMQSNPFW